MVRGKVKCDIVHVCSVCENQLTKCSCCDEYFVFDGEEIECKADGLRHVCSDCLDGDES